ncbi:MAG: NAD(P)H-dependent glycerol-3-phosphate dehydrogenase [Planctomycetota bacterium]|nr:NAD(P)H-dependent glycerol-3-phosphate dehydrogenase [Planctomycetota bacterium]
MKIAVIGNGAFGTALAMVGLRAGHEPRIWGHDREYTKEFARSRRNPRYLDESFELADEILVSADAQVVLEGVDLVIAAVPAQHARSVLTDLREQLPAGVPLISTAKGLEQETALRPSQVLGEAVGGGHPVCVLSGPTHAEEIAAGLPATAVLASEDGEWLLRLQGELSSASFRIYRHDDLLGVELCGALKNVMALAAGMGEGLGFGDNAKAAILSRGIAEMARYGMAEGADQSSFFGLAGVGDLAATAFSPHGRNRAFGVRIGRGETLDEILASTPKVSEGVWTSRVVVGRAKELGVEMPISDAVCAVLFEGVSPADAVSALMERDPKREELGSGQAKA